MADLNRNLERLDQDLEIMERHATELDVAEGEIQNNQKRRDREYKDSHFHSVPKPRKHLR